MLKALLLVVLVVGVAGMGGVAWLASRPAPPPVTAEAPPAKVLVLAAARPLRAGALLKPDDLKGVEVAADAVPSGAREDSRPARQELIGAMVRRSLQPGEPILPEDVLRPGDRGFLAAVLGPDMRAITVGVDAISGLAGLIWPGDRVDVLLTQQLNDQGLPPAQRVAGETVLSDVRVIAIDQNLIQGATESDGTTRQVRTVTLEVTQREAERIAVAARLGRLSLSVRSAVSSGGSDKDDAQRTHQVTWGGDVSPALRGGPKPPEQQAATVRVFQGTRAEEFRF